MVIEMFPNMVEKTKENFVIPTFASCINYTCSFDIWMCRASFDAFTMVVSFINTSWEPTHVAIRIFEIHNIAGATITNKIKVLLDSFGFI